MRASGAIQLGTHPHMHKHRQSSDDQVCTKIGREREWGGGRGERETGRQTDRGRETDRQGERETDRQRQIQTGRERERERETDRGRKLHQV